MEQRHLTQPDAERADQIKQTVPGMAYLAGTGPRGETCFACMHFPWREGLDKNVERRCGKYIEMTKRLTCRRAPNAPVPPQTPACKYFDAREIAHASAERERT